MIFFYAYYYGYYKEILQQLHGGYNYAYVTWLQYDMKAVIYSNPRPLISLTLKDNEIASS